jgi:hypothetical protein
MDGPALGYPLLLCCLILTVLVWFALRAIWR